MERGMEALAAGDLAGAKEAFAGAGEQAPEDFRVQRALGIVSYKEGDYPQAVSYFSKALSVLGEDGEAVAREDILRYKADAETAWGKSADAEDAAANYADAVSDYGQLIALDNENAEYYLLRGRAFLELDDVDGAISDFRTALSASADNLDYCEDIYLGLKEHGAARAGMEFLEVIRQAGAGEADGSRYGRACLELAHVQMEQEQYGEALSVIQEALSSAEEPARKELLYAEAASYEYLLDFETALEKFRAYRDAYGSDETLEHEIAFLVTRTEFSESRDLEVDPGEAEVTEPAEVEIEVTTEPAA